jgi:hypothetical protein
LSEEPDGTIDVAKVQYRLDAKKDNPYTVLEGSCQMPTDASGGLKKSHIKESTNTFLVHMDKRGYNLVSRISLLGPFPATEIDKGSEVVEGKEEWRIRGVFKKDKPELQRIEIDPALIKGDSNG